MTVDESRVLPHAANHTDPCETCGMAHTRCLAHTVHRNARPCRTPTGTDPEGNLCKWHRPGGLEPTKIHKHSRIDRDRNKRIIAKATNGKNTQAMKAKALAEMTALNEGARFAQKRDISGTDALIETMQYTAGEVSFWRRKVSELPEDQLAGMQDTKYESGMQKGENTNMVTTEVSKHIYVTMLHDAQDRLSALSIAVMKAGIDERRMKLAETIGDRVADVMRRTLGRMFEVMVASLKASGVDDQAIHTALYDTWTESVTMIVPQELRALSAPVVPSEVVS